MTTIEKGMYVRTKYGIAKVKEVTSMYYVLDKEIMLCNLENYMDCCTDSDLLCEPSFDIIDVIEKGDLVNDMFVESNNGVVLETLELDYEYSTLGHMRYVEIYKDRIDTVVTHEQLAAGAYEVIPCEKD